MFMLTVNTLNEGIIRGGIPQEYNIVGDRLNPCNSVFPVLRKTHTKKF